MRTLSNVTHRPSAEKVWQHPAGRAAPTMPFLGPLRAPDEVHAASKRAASASIPSFVRVSIRSSRRPLAQVAERLFGGKSIARW